MTNFFQKIFMIKSFKLFKSTLKFKVKLNTLYSKTFKLENLGLP